MRQFLGPLAGESLDTLLDGRVSVLQSRAGYRFSLDAILLAHFVRIRDGEQIADLGTGNGVIALLLAALHAKVQVVGLEIQEAMVERATRSVELSGLEHRVRIVQGNVCSVAEMLSPESFDVAVSNPPYRRLRSGRINPNLERQLARHEIKGGLRDFLRAGRYLLRRKGKMVLIYPVTRGVDLLQIMREEGVEPKRLRLVHSYEGEAATLILVEGIKGGKHEIKVLPPLVVYTKAREYTPEVRAMVGD
jgi:tRNA1Val (adenine37-N6)-methyltransferase